MKASMTKQPEFTELQEGDYQRVAWYLFRGFLDGSLPDYVYDDLASAKEDLMGAFQSYAERELRPEYVSRALKSENPGEVIFAIRLIHFSIDHRELYSRLREMFLGIPSSLEDEWLLQKKKYLAAAMPYFVQYESDDDIKWKVLEYLESTRREQVVTTLRFFGADKWPQRFIEAPKDEKRRSKHWMYLWSFRAISEEGLIDESTKLRLKNVIQAYSHDHQGEMSDFERGLLQKALSV